MLDDDIGAITI